MGIANWFTFRTREEKELHEAEYLKKMFPLGEAQKEMEQSVLDQCIKTKVPDSEKIYLLLILKEKNALKNEEKERQQKKWCRGTLARKLTKEERAILLSFSELLGQCESMEEFPSVLEVEDFSKKKWLPKVESWTQGKKWKR